jgi:hypothetical protein
MRGLQAKSVQSDSEFRMRPQPSRAVEAEKARDDVDNDDFHREAQA